MVSIFGHISRDTNYHGDIAFVGESNALRLLGARGSGLDGIAVAAAFKITMLEGIEVAFIVIAIGTAGRVY